MNLIVYKDSNRFLELCIMKFRSQPLDGIDNRNPLTSTLKSRNPLTSTLKCCNTLALALLLDSILLFVALDM